MNLYSILYSNCYRRLIDTQPNLIELAVNGFRPFCLELVFSAALIGYGGLRKFFLPFGNAQSTIFLFCRRNETGAPPRRFLIVLFSSVFPISLSSGILLASALSARVEPANFTIKQSDARTASVTTMEKASKRGEEDRTGSLLETDLKRKRRGADLADRVSARIFRTTRYYAES